MASDHRFNSISSMPASIPGSVDSPDDIRLALRSWPEVERYLESCKGIIIPLGSTEQHGPTGAIGTDALVLCAVDTRGMLVKKRFAAPERFCNGNWAQRGIEEYLVDSLDTSMRATAAAADVANHHAITVAPPASMPLSAASRTFEP